VDADRKSELLGVAPGLARQRYHLVLRSRQAKDRVVDTMQYGRTRQFLLAHLGRAALLVALVAGAVAVPLDASTAAGTAKPIVAPKRIGIYLREAAVKKLNNSVGKKVIAREAAWNARTAEAVSKAYRGAPAVAESYAREDLTIFFKLVAVRARTPGEWALYTDPKVLGSVRPQAQVKSFGAVQCQITNVFTPAGQKPAADSVQTVECRRTSAHLTVTLKNISEPLMHHPRAVAAALNQAWGSIVAA
jgi:hypothetical protein